MRTSHLLAGAAVAAVLTGCSESPQLDRAVVEAHFSREHVELGPAPDARLVALGRALYHEKRLSARDNLSCASCHDLDRFGQDGEPTSPGSTAERGDRNSPTSLNAFRQFAQFWDYRAKDVEEQATGPVVNPIEHGFKTAEEFVTRLKSVPGVNEKFAEAFPGEEDPVTLANFGKAVGAFERTLTTRSRFDDYLDGDDNALTVEEKRGLAAFIELNCTMCHNGRTVGGGIPQKLGLVEPYPTKDEGRAKVTGNAVDKHLFKVPMLLNVAETGPYFHDGSVATLEESVKLMARHQLGKQLTPDQLKSIVAFLKALTGKLDQ